VIFIALAQSLGVEVILGAFMAGVIVSLVSADEGSVLRPKLNALGYGFFIPIFFVMVGVQLDLAALAESPHGLLLVPLLTAMAFAVKFGAALVYRPLFSWRETLALGSLTSARLSLIIAVAAIGVEIGAIGASTNAAIVLVAVISVVAAPVLFNRIVPPAPGPPARRVIVAGSTPHARLLARRLVQHGERVTVLTANAQLVEGAELDFEVVLTEPTRQADRLREAGVEQAHALVTMLDDEEESLRIAVTARETFGLENVVAHVKNPQVAERFRRSGIRAVDASISTVVMLEGVVRHPHALSLVAETDIEHSIVDVRLTNPRLEDARLRDIPLSGDALVLMIVRDDEVVIPRGHTRLKRDDLVTLVGSPEAVHAAADRLR
jgi:Trk K+ transport system NAD-binding subunit